MRSDSPETRVGRSFRTVLTWCIAATSGLRQLRSSRGVAGRLGERICSGDCCLDRSRRPAEAASRPRPLPQEMRTTCGRSGASCARGLLTSTATMGSARRWVQASALARAAPTGSAHDTRSKPGFLWEGSSDPDSDGGQCAALGSSPGGNHDYFPQSALARLLERSLWERACSRLRPCSKPAARNRRVAAKVARPLNAAGWISLSTHARPAVRATATAARAGRATWRRAPRRAEASAPAR